MQAFFCLLVLATEEFCLLVLTQKVVAATGVTLHVAITAALLFYCCPMCNSSCHNHHGICLPKAAVLCDVR